MDAKAVVDRMKTAISVATDADLATRLRVPLPTLNAWKKRNSVPFNVVEDFCTSYDCTLDWLIFGDRLKPFGADQERLEARSVQIGIRIALETSNLDRNTIDDILARARSHKLMIAAHVGRQVHLKLSSMEDALQAHEDAITASRNEGGHHVP